MRELFVLLIIVAISGFVAHGTVEVFDFGWDLFGEIFD